VVAIALGLVLAGTGDLRALRLFRKLNSRVSPQVTYGNHMAVHMALGFLFMGGGTHSFGTTKEDVAAIVTAVFPRFPNHPSDNRYHLQPLRHLHVLAAAPRVIVTRDIDTGETCYCPISLQLSATAAGPGRAGEELQLVAPCIAPPLGSVDRLTVGGPRYWPVKLELKGDPERALSLRRYGVVYVKRKAGQLPYAQDPKVLAALTLRCNRSLSACGPGTADHARIGANLVDEGHVAVGLRLGRSLDSDPISLQFAKYACEPTTPTLLELVRPVRTGVEPAAFRLSVLHEGLVQEKPEALATYLELEAVLARLGVQPSAAAAATAAATAAVGAATFTTTTTTTGGDGGSAGSFASLGTASTVRGLRALSFVLSYYGQVYGRVMCGCDRSNPLIAASFLLAARTRVDTALAPAALGLDNASVQVAFRAALVGASGAGGVTVGGPDGDAKMAGYLRAVAAFYQLPTRNQLRRLPPQLLQESDGAVNAGAVLPGLADQLPFTPPMALFRLIDLLWTTG
jgi:hypothetical protein